ncbi:YHS domain-containing protein [Methanoculleus chikugoensis]|uniref:YHS domain-containing protein n=1 Tax=Methanoculleus chikugoensis TaxID=118126 RepID=UPI001FB5082A|nr:YHS domain-containing protein [Methanoculleus chikugoensis]
MDVDEATAKFTSEYKGGKTYYFCAPGCKKLFERDPEAYLKVIIFFTGGVSRCGSQCPYTQRIIGYS